MMKLGWNGAVVDGQAAAVSVFDHGFLYGIGLFETFRAYGGRPFLLDRHLGRLAEGCARLGIRYQPDEEQMRRHIADVLEANGLRDAYIRLSVSAGVASLGVYEGEYECPNVAVYVKPLPPLNDELYETGKPLQLLKTRRNLPETDIRLKSFHYINNRMAKRELLQYPWAVNAEGLFLSAQGYLAEGIVSNLFFVEDGELCTPAADTGILAGITRERVLEIAAEAGIPANEGFYNWERLTRAEEVFLTNSIQEIVPVTSLYDMDGRRYGIGAGKIGAMTKRLLQRYRAETLR
jgi:4-amino-4-deoxychorismate lyase